MNTAYRCLVCKQQYSETGQQTRSPWQISVRGEVICRRCCEAGKNARQREEYTDAPPAAQTEGEAMKIWSCKIGEVADELLPNGSDVPMREAVQDAYQTLTGKWPHFLFSGWGAELTEPERAVVENRAPVPPAVSGWQPIACSQFRSLMHAGQWTSKVCATCGRTEGEHGHPTPASQEKL